MSAQVDEMLAQVETNLDEITGILAFGIFGRRGHDLGDWDLGAALVRLAERTLDVVAMARRDIAA